MVSTQTIRRGASGVVLALMVAATVVSARTSASGTAPTDPECVTPPAAIAPTATRILTIGDSLTSAASGDYTWRYFLWKHLVTNGGTSVPPTSPAAYDFVGPYQDLVDPVSLARDNTDYRCPFDEDNGAIPGAFLAQYLDTTAGPSNLIKDMVANGGSPADVLLVFAGVNDLTRVRSGALSSLTPAQLLTKDQALVTQARAANPNVKVVFLTAPAAGGTPAAGSTLAKIDSYNTQLLADAAGWGTVASPVVAVSTAQNWGGTDLTYDSVHPNPPGEITIASDVADGLHSLGVGPAAARPLPNLSSLDGPRDPAVLAQPVAAGNNVTLSWTLPLGSTVTMVQRADLTTGSGWVNVHEVKLSSCTSTKPYTCTYVDTGYIGGDVDQYRLVSAKGTSVTPRWQYSTTVTSTVMTVPEGATATPPPLTPVTGITASAGVHAITVHWNAETGAAGYFVSATPTGGGPVIVQAYAPATSATVTGLVAGRPYAIKVAAARPGVNGPPANGPTLKPSAYPLAKPKLTLKKSHRRFTVSWPAVAHATSYEVQYRAPGSRTWKQVQYSTTRSWLSFKTKRGSKYTVRVRAYDSYVAGPFSAAATYTAR